MPIAITIWLFHRGSVFMMTVWIFSVIIVSLFCTRRICGAIWIETMRVSSRSWIFRSNRTHCSVKSFAACASSGSPLFCAFSCSATRVTSRSCASFFLPARMYIDSSLKYVMFTS